MYDVDMSGLKNAPNPSVKESRPVIMEIFVFLAIVGMVGAIIYMVLNPHKNEEEARNSARSQGVVEIMKAVKSYVDETGNLPETIPLNRECASIGNEICIAGGSDCKGYVELTSLLVEGGFLTEVPQDNLRSNGRGSGFYISHDGDGNVVVCAPLAERNVDISLKQFVY